MGTNLIGEDLKQMEKSHGGPLNHWVGGIIHITVKTFYDLQYLTMHPSCYMNAPEEPDFLAIKNGTEYIIDHSHEPIMYSRNKIYKTDEIPHQCYFKAGDSEINKDKEYSNFLKTYCDADYYRYLADRL